MNIYALSHSTQYTILHTHNFRALKIVSAFFCFSISYIVNAKEISLYKFLLREKKKKSEPKSRGVWEAGGGRKSSYFTCKKTYFRIYVRELALKVRLLHKLRLDQKKRLQQWSNIANGHSLFCYEQKPATTKKITRREEETQ